MTGHVVSVGSLNLDLSYALERLPRPGETLLSSSSARLCGGKGANQAAAAAAVGARVTMVGAVGDDDAGRVMIEDLQARGVDTDAVRHATDTPSGTAVIFRGRQDRDNIIVVDAGANASIAPVDVQLDVVAGAEVVLCQLEIPIETVTAAARHSGGTFVLNIAPWQLLPEELLDEVDVLIANQTEIALQLGTQAPESVAAAARMLRTAAPQCSVIVTLGAQGAVVFDQPRGTTTELAATDVTVVDTTGAGDCFCGVLAARLADGAPLSAAAAEAVAGASLSTTRVGARGALPSLSEIRQAMRGMNRAVAGGPDEA